MQMCISFFFSHLSNPPSSILSLYVSLSKSLGLPFPLRPVRLNEKEQGEGSGSRMLLQLWWSRCLVTAAFNFSQLSGLRAS